MAYQQNLGAITEADVRRLVSAPTWADVKSQALTRFKAEEGMSPPYSLGVTTRLTDSRYGPGTVYEERREIPAGAEVNITGQYGNWFLTDQGDYVLKSHVKEGVSDSQIRAAILKVTPRAIKEAISVYDFPASGISTDVVKNLLVAVVNRIVFLAVQALGGTPDR